MPAGATYEPIATTTVSGSSVSSITFNSLGSYTDLRLVIVGKASSDYSTVGCRYNSDTGTNYSSTRLYGTGSSAISNRTTNTNYAEIDAYNGMMTSTVTMAMMDIFNYTGSTYKTSLGVGSQDLNGSGAVSRTVSIWRSTSAITSLTLISSGGSANFSIGTTVTIYGITAA